MATRVQQPQAHRYYSSTRSSGRYHGGGGHRQGRSESQGSFFLGNIDKELTREQVYDLLRKNADIYISKFDMPKVDVGTTDDHGRPINCAGFAFVHTRTQAQAQAMLKRKTIRIGKLNAEIKPYDQAKREASQTRHRERQASQSSQVIANSQVESDVEDWTQENNEGWMLQVKLNQFEPDSFAIESAYVSDANDETMSLSQSVVNSEHGMEQSSTSRRRPESKLDMGDSKQIGKYVMKSLLDDDITPTAERCNAKMQELMDLNTVSQMVPIQETCYNNPLLENPVTTNVLISQQTTPLVQTTQQQPLPYQLNTAPATLQPIVTLQQTPTHFTQSPVYLTLMAEAARLRAINSNNEIYQNCYDQWINYYMAPENAQAVVDLFNTSANQYHQSLNQKVELYVAL